MQLQKVTSEMISGGERIVMPGDSVDLPHRFAASADSAESDGRRDSISVGSSDEAVTRMQLAARWAERFGGTNDSLQSALGRFRLAYDYLDAVTHGMEPPAFTEPPSPRVPDHQGDRATAAPVFQNLQPSMPSAAPPAPPVG